MFTQATHTTHQSPSRAALPGCWKLDTGRAISLTPATAGVLRIAHGRVWVTMDMLRGDTQAAGDLFLVPGRGLVVQAGQRLVLESSGPEREAPAYFSWDPLPQAQARAVGRALPTGRWQQAVVQPVRDLGRALGQAGMALARLGLGLAGLLLAPARSRAPLPERS